MFKGKYSELVSHQTMIQDEHRTLNFIKAIEKAISPGDVVIDFGSGSGLLAIKAAKCGAKRVYAIERNASTADILRANIKQNKVDDVVEVFVGNAQQFIDTMNISVDAIISETIGDAIFEGSTKGFFDLIKAYNIEKQIPCHFKLYCHGSYITRKQQQFDNNKKQLDGIDLSILNESVVSNPMLDCAYFEGNHDKKDYYFNLTPANDSYELLSFSKPEEIKHDITVIMDDCSKDGDYLMLYWNIHLYDDVCITNSPDRPETDNHSFYQRLINVTGYNSNMFTIFFDYEYDKEGIEDQPYNNITVV